MGRRFDHNRTELEALILDAGRTLMAEVGHANFSAREVAKRVGYSIGTIHNVFGGIDGLLNAINGQTHELLIQSIDERLESAETDRVTELVRGYVEFALGHPRLWMAMSAHHVGSGALPPEQLERVCALIGLAESEIAALLPAERGVRAARLARSLIAHMHGHCVFALTGIFGLSGEVEVLALMRDRLREMLAATAA